MAMAANDTKLKVKSYVLDLGLRTISIDNIRDIVPYHEIQLAAVIDGTQQEVNITIECWADLKHFAPTELGFYTAPPNGRITIKAPISEFDRVCSILRNEKPVFFIFNQFNVVGTQHPDRKSITAVSIVTGNEPIGESE